MALCDSGCGKEGTEEDHFCPYAIEIAEDDDSFLCNCCEDCEFECAMDI